MPTLRPHALTRFEPTIVWAEVDGMTTATSRQEKRGSTVFARVEQFCCQKVLRHSKHPKDVLKKKTNFFLNTSGVLGQAAA
jgi:hypothetical protein